MLHRGLPDFGAAIFDLDGTILDSLHIWQQIDVDFLSLRGFEVPDDYMQTIQPLGSYDTAVYTIRRFHLNERPEDLQAEWFSMAYKAYRDSLELKPGVSQFVSLLSEMGIPMAVASSSDRLLIDAALERNHLSGMIREIVTVKDAGKGKGFPDIYRLAARRLRQKPQQCCVFEDIPEALRSARKAGCFAVGLYDAINRIPFPILAQDADLCVHSFEELIMEA